MVDLRVIEGSGSKEERQAAYAEERAADAFETLAIEVLRSVARGADNAYRVGVALRALYETLTADGVRLHAPIRAGVRDVHERLMPVEEDPYDSELRWLLHCSLRLTAEMLATDGFAKGRTSQRRSEFRRALESYLLDKEMTSRQGGGSYLARLLGQLPPLPPASSPSRSSTKRKPKKPTKPSKT